MKVLGGCAKALPEFKVNPSPQWVPIISTLIWKPGCETISVIGAWVWMVSLDTKLKLQSIRIWEPRIFRG